MIEINELRFLSTHPRVARPHGTSPLEKIDLANQSWHIGAASGRGSPLHSLDGARNQATLC